MEDLTRSSAARLGLEPEKRQKKRKSKRGRETTAPSGQWSPKRSSRSHVLRPFYTHQCRLSQFFRVVLCFFSFFPFFLFFGFRPRRGWWGGVGGGCGFLEVPYGWFFVGWSFVGRCGGAPGLALGLGVGVSGSAVRAWVLAGAGGGGVFLPKPPNRYIPGVI
jgi:hypothetical protein